MKRSQSPTVQRLYVKESANMLDQIIHVKRLWNKFVGACLEKFVNLVLFNLAGNTDNLDGF